MTEQQSKMMEVYDLGHFILDFSNDYSLVLKQMALMLAHAQAGSTSLPQVVGEAVRLTAPDISQMNEQERRDFNAAVAALTGEAK